MSVNVFAVLLGLILGSSVNLALAATLGGVEAKAIVTGATETFGAFRKSALGKTGASEIPKEFWTASIRCLKPIKVYLHMNNIVVVQNVAEGKEAGLYIYQPLSSYLPMDGVDRFVLTPKPSTAGTYTLGTGVFSYERMATNRAVQERGPSRSGEETGRQPPASCVRSNRP